MKREEAVEKIGKLFALALDQAGRPEGERAREAADRMRAKFRIDESEVMGRGEMDPMIRVEIEVATQSNWRRGIVAAVARLCDVYAVVVAGTRLMRLYGRRSDIEVALYLRDAVFAQMWEAMRAWRRNRSPDRREIHSWRGSFAMGVTGKVDQIVEMREAKANSGSETALVPRDRYLKAMWWAQQLYGTPKTAHTRVVLNEAGYDAGQRVQFRRGVRTTRRQLGGR